MADPATNTSYPGSIDPLPEIDANDKQNDPGIEHDVMHDKAHAILNALQALVGTSGDGSEASTVLGRLLALEGGPESSDVLDVVSEPSAFTAVPETHSGARRYVRAGGDVTFDSSEGYEVGQVFSFRATAGIELIEDGVTLTPPAGGTLDLAADMAVQVVMTSATAGDVIGQTVAAP